MCASAKDTHVTDTTTQPDPSAAEQPEQGAKTTSAPRRSTGGLGGKVLAELQEIAAGLDISGAGPTVLAFGRGLDGVVPPGWALHELEVEPSGAHVLAP